MLPMFGYFCLSETAYNTSVGDLRISVSVRQLLEGDKHHLPVLLPALLALRQHLHPWEGKQPAHDEELPDHGLPQGCKDLLDDRPVPLPRHPPLPPKMKTKSPAMEELLPTPKDE